MLGVHAHKTSADPENGGAGNGDAGHAGTGNGGAVGHSDTSPSDAGHEMC
ncbi:MULTISPECIES: hypothetical protein [unclassified Streptomyces]|nr:MULTISPECIES: hypothetical protein [unclassified Streptomyces]MYR29880.1 hypothetical protein [Streptomyces sp. SID4945]SCF47978.1 hypothetical protein GA0115257_11967 [Streptomyces sp. LcepLS]